MCGGREEGEGGGGGGRTAAAAAAASPRWLPQAPRLPGARLSSSAAGRLVLVPPPPPRQRRKLRESLFWADLAGARRGGRCSGRGAGQAARGRRRLLAGTGWRAGSREAPGAGSAPARAPLAGACLSRGLTAQVNSIGGRRRRRRALAERLAGGVCGGTGPPGSGLRSPNAPSAPPPDTRSSRSGTSSAR